MKALLLLALTGIVAAAAPVPAPETLAHSGEPYWFKRYATSPYSEIWTADLALKNFAGGVPKVVDAIKKNGGTLTQPLETFVSSRKDQTQQLSFSLPQKNAKALLKALRVLGDMADPAVRPQGTRILIEEVRAKIAAIMKEKTEHGPDLARVPAAAAAEEEILEHLLMIEELAQRAEIQVLVDMSVRQK